jgi:hypothetical protein
MPDMYPHMRVHGGYSSLLFTPITPPSTACNYISQICNQSYLIPTLKRGRKYWIAIKIIKPISPSSLSPIDNIPHCNLNLPSVSSIATSPPDSLGTPRPNPGIPGEVVLASSEGCTSALQRRENVITSVYSYISSPIRPLLNIYERSRVSFTISSKPPIWQGGYWKPTTNGIRISMRLTQYNLVINYVNFSPSSSWVIHRPIPWDSSTVIFIIFPTIAHIGCEPTSIILILRITISRISPFNTSRFSYIRRAKLWATSICLLPLISSPTSLESPESSWTS